MPATARPTTTVISLGFITANLHCYHGVFMGVRSPLREDINPEKYDLASLLATLKTDGHGLSHADVITRQNVYGKNRLQLHRSRLSIAMLAVEFIALFPLLLLLLAAAILAFFVDELRKWLVRHGVTVLHA